MYIECVVKSMLFKLWFGFVKANFFDEKISAKLRGPKEMNIDKKLCSYVMAVMALFLNSPKII